MASAIYMCFILASLLAIANLQEIKVYKDGQGARVFVGDVEMPPDPTCDINAKTSEQGREYDYQCQAHCLKLGHGTGQCITNVTPVECKCTGQASDPSYKSEAYTQDWQDEQECQEVNEDE